MNELLAETLTFQETIIEKVDGVPTKSNNCNNEQSRFDICLDKKTYNLRYLGGSIHVTDSNKSEYLQLLVNYYLHDSCATQVINIENCSVVNLNGRSRNLKKDFTK